MAELVIGPLLSMVKEKASSYLLEQYNVMKGMEEQRKILERKLPAILDIIQDAEEKGAFRPGVAAWLKDLKTAAYEANDVFDEFNYEALRREAEKKGQSSKLSVNALRHIPARNPIVFRYRMGKKLRRIVQTIEVLVNEMNAFGFRHLQQPPPSNQWRQTDPIILDTDKDIVSRSRDQEKKKIVAMLLHEAIDMDLMVLPIVGMGGLGKTTFAQLIYNDDEIKNHFKLQKWCCVSDDFDVSSIANNICQDGKKSGEKALHDLQSMISGKRYLIVLDDVWHHLTLAHKWEKLKTCLKQGAKGSAVLITTRDSQVAQIMITGAANPHNIEKLSHEHLKEIIQSRVPFISVYKEKWEIMRMLLVEAANMDLMVLPILGSDKVGKTNFVQLIYYDPEVEKHFELRRWCRLPEDFHIATIESNICVTNEEDHEKQLKWLESTISGKRYLIVLDDVRNLDADKWVKLKTCLKRGQKGSAILTTTRDPEVAQIMKMGVTEAFNIEKKFDGIVHWRAFISQISNSDEVYGIVDSIVARCDGSPLAAKAFGSMLSTKGSLNEWKDISAKSNICNERTEILPILKLSFDDLPSHMKQCFAFCALFPKDYEIDVDLLIQLWMAHDFIPVQDGDQPETVGEQIFKDLTWRSFFQDIKQTVPVGHYLSGSLSLRKRTICKIHDLMHDIALSVMGKECATIVGKPTVNKLLQNPTRHVFLSVYGASVVFRKRLIISLLDHLLKKKTAMLQTLFFTDYYHPLDISQYTSLRALHLLAMAYTVHKHLTGQIQHLRYLNLSGHRFVQLPEDISIMYNLQTLDLSFCTELHHLPKDMKHLSSLRHLYTHGCESLTCMPSGLKQMTALQTLTYFVAGDSSDCSTIGELGNLNLGGELELSGLENVTEQHAKKVRLEHKEKITHLSLEWDSKGQEQSVLMDCHEKVLYALKPHDGLQTLRIVNYKGTCLPSWATDLRKLQHLTELHLHGCTLCEEFPQFYHLKGLEVLYLEKLDKLQSLCSDMVSVPFPALKLLRLHDLESLERWVATEAKDELTFPVLEEIDIENCPNLRCLPEAPGLKVIRLDEGNALLSLGIVKSIRHMSSLSKLEMCVRDTEALPEIDSSWDSSQKLEPSLHDMKAAPLSKLSISGCNFFFFPSQSELTFMSWKSFEKLVDLSIAHCDLLIYWPEQVFKSLVSLKRLSIFYCKKLIGPKPVTEDEPTLTEEQVLPHLNKILVRDCECLVQLFILPSSLRIIDIEQCPSLKLIWEKEKHLEACTSLEYCQDTAPTSALEQSPYPMIPCPCLVNLEIRECAKLVALPYLPPSLKNLLICGCGELCSVSGQLGGLKRLHIYGCNKLLSVHSLEDASSLETLFLSSCRCLASLGASGGPGTFSALRGLEIEYCPAMVMKQFNKNVLEGLVHKEISHAHSSNPYEGPKLGEPKSWKYAIPWC